MEESGLDTETVESQYQLRSGTASVESSLVGGSR